MQMLYALFKVKIEENHFFLYLLCYKLISKTMGTSSPCDGQMFSEMNNFISASVSITEQLGFHELQ